MATRTLTLAPDLADSWLFRQLRPTVAPQVKTKARAVAAPKAKAETPEPLSTEQEAQILAHAAREFEADFDAVLDGLNNIHGRAFDDIAEAFGQRLGALAEALEGDDYEAARSASNRLNLVLHEMQANIPAWSYVRGLQMLARRCSKIGS